MQSVPYCAPRRRTSDSGATRFRRAAVIVPVIHRAEPAILFTRRTDHLPSHAGQICFPGGGHAPADETLIRDRFAGACRKKSACRPERVTIAGFLDAYETLNTGFRILPVVGFLDENFQLTMNRAEVAEVFEAPLSFLIDPRQSSVNICRTRRRDARILLDPIWRT